MLNILIMCSIENMRLRQNFSSLQQMHNTIKQSIQKQQQKRLLEQSFKVNLSKIQHLAAGYKTNCVCYMLLKLLPETVHTDIHNADIQLNLKIKQVYFSLLQKQAGQCSDSFQLMVVYLVKLAAVVFAKLFPQIDWHDCQGEFCVILYHCFLGVKINQETYDQLSRHYLHSKIVFNEEGRNNRRGSKDSPRKERSVKTLKTMKSLKSIKSGVSNQHHKTKFKKFKSKFQDRDSLISMESPCFEDYRKTLQEDYYKCVKKNLHVDPLPPLKRKKINYRQYTTEYSDLPSAQMACQTSHQQRKNRRQYIFSNQLSTTLKAFHPMDTIFELGCKKIRFNHSMQHANSTLKESSLPVKDESIQMSTEPKQMQSSNIKKDIKEWITTISSIKKQVVGLKRNRDFRPSKLEQKSKEKKPTLQRINSLLFAEEVRTIPDNKISPIPFLNCHSNPCQRPSPRNPSKKENSWGILKLPQSEQTKTKFYELFLKKSKQTVDSFNLKKQLRNFEKDCLKRIC